MLLLGLGLVLLALKYWQIGVVAEWTWWAVLTPFPLAVVWWTLADYFGYTKKKVLQRELARKQARIDKHRAAMSPGRPRR